MEKEKARGLLSYLKTKSLKKRMFTKSEAVRYRKMKGCYKMPVVDKSVVQVYY